MFNHLSNKQFILPAILMAGMYVNIATGPGMAKSQVGDLIKQVEDGTDKFRDYLEKRGETAKRLAWCKQRPDVTRANRNGRAKEQRQNEERCVGGFAGRTE